MQFLSLLTLASAAAAFTVPQRRDSKVEISHFLTAPDGSKFPLKESVINSAAYKPFQESEKRMYNPQGDIQRRTDRPENPPAHRNATWPDYIFTLMCDTNGFRGNCLAFGARPGVCVSFRDFDEDKSTTISDMYDNKVVSLSTNTGGNCQYYYYLHCDNKGDDSGITLNYDYDLSIILPSKQNTIEYYRNISSWRC